MKYSLEKYMQSYIDSLKESKVREAMEYALMGGGKRLRPLLLLNLVEDFGCDPKIALPAASALEMIHTYSLIHDDLPSMDNDDYRRHRLTSHKVFGEAVAILAGDSLLTEAFRIVLQSNLSDRQLVFLVEILTRTSGCEGMVLGQNIDIENDFEDLDTLLESYRLKTGKLFAAAFEMAAIITNSFDYQITLRQIGYNLGVLFQIQDDLLEESKSFEEIGKLPESDEEKDKKTILSFCEVEEALSLRDRLSVEVKELIQELPIEANSLNSLIDQIIMREY